MANGPSVPSLPESSACSEIRIANTMSELARVAELVDAFGADHKLPNSVIVALNVSLDEILNNIISYGYDDTGRHDIVVRLELRRENVQVVVEDDGRPFNPLEVAPPNLRDKSREGGVFEIGRHAEIGISGLELKIDLIVERFFECGRKLHNNFQPATGVSA